jgi:DNA-binding HxlR family transcriptional regulator
VSQSTGTPLHAELSATLEKQASTELAENLNRLMLGNLNGLEAPIERAMELVGDKYSFQLLHLLSSKQVMRFVELEQQIPGISPRTLSARLKHLEKARLIDRRQYPTIPPKVEYRLTERGADLAQTFAALENWVERWYPYAKPATPVL